MKLLFENEFAPLKLGRSIVLLAPVVLAPMAGITNAPYRDICRRQGAGLCISEMVTAHLLVQNHKRTNQMATFWEQEFPRSIQLYGTDQKTLQEATKYLIYDKGVQHIDLNFGCPMKKIVSQGGGAAASENPSQLASLVKACVTAAERAEVPVTVKIRMGLKDDRPTFMATGMAAQDAGASWVALHARSAEQMYRPPAHWDAIAQLVTHLDIPVLGNGDVFECWDALRMIRQTGAAGVVIGRGCLGRPWLFRELSYVFSGQLPPPTPNLGEVLLFASEHITKLASWLGDEQKAVFQMRKMISLYLLGFTSVSTLQEELIKAETLKDWTRLIQCEEYDRNEPYPLHTVRIPRLKG